MSDIAIKVEGLSKQYRIGERESYKALRDVITDAAAAPFRRMRSAFRNGNGASPSALGPFPAIRNSKSENRNSIWALDDVSFEVKRGEVVGIIGRNGAGKSTLLKILSRITKPTRGRATIHGRVGSLLEVGTGFHPELTGRENIYLNAAILGMRKTEVDRKFDEIVAFAEVEKFIDTPVKRYSSGMYVRLAFAVAAHMETEVLMVDEVLAVGDMAFQKKCLGKMGEVAREGRTVLFVSHNTGAITKLCSEALWLDAGGIVAQGSAHQIVQEYYQQLLSKEKDGGPSHFIYDATENTYSPDFAITRIEVLDDSFEPKPIVATWDRIVLRIWFCCRKSLEVGSVAVELASFEGAKLLLLSTQPDGSLPLNFRCGSQFVDCIIDRIPLAAGEYIVGAGLAIPNAEWLWYKGDVGRLTIVARDVYGSGLAPISSRSLLAVQHHWQLMS